MDTSGVGVEWGLGEERKGKERRWKEWIEIGGGRLNL